MSLLYSAAALAGGVVVTIIDGRKAKADITLPNPGGGNYTAEFELEFEVANLQNLTVACIGISADVLDATEIADIEEPACRTRGRPSILHFRCASRSSLRRDAGCRSTTITTSRYETDDLVYAPFSPYRLVKAPIGGQFQYVTGSVTQAACVRAAAPAVSPNS